MSLYKLSVVLGALLGVFVAGIVLLEAEIAVAQQPETPEEPDTVMVVPTKAMILVGQTQQFRVTGKPGAYTWMISDSSADGIGTVDADGLFTAQAGGWVIIAVQDEEENVIASTDTVVVMGGPTKIAEGRGGRVFSADDPQVVVNFPPQASAQAMNVLIAKMSEEDLPEQAKGRARVVVIFEITAFATETGEDVGGKGFGEKVRMTLHYEDEDMPEDVDEEDLTVATFNEHARQWEEVPRGAVVEVNRDGNTITVEVEHFSLWGVVDRTSLTVVAVDAATWGQIKRLVK